MEWRENVKKTSKNIKYNIKALKTDIFSENKITQELPYEAKTIY